jgi:hypothetical protein
MEYEVIEVDAPTVVVVTDGSYIDVAWERCVGTEVSTTKCFPERSVVVHVDSVGYTA